MIESFRRRLVFNLGILVFLLIVFISLIVFLGKDISQKAGYIAATRNNLNVRLRQLNDLARLREEAKVAEPNLIKLQTLTPTRDKTFSLPRRLEELARANNLGFSFAFGSENPPADNLGSINFNMTVEGSYQNILSFIRTIETGPYFMKISSFDIIRQESGFRALLGGSVFYLPQ